MSWVRAHPLLANWPTACPPPELEISSDLDGNAIVELAWDPQSLLAPAVYPEPLRYYTTANDFSPTLQATPITLSQGRATWPIPDELWQAYTAELTKAAQSPPASTFSGNLYYRIRLQPAGDSTALIWPADDALSGENGDAAPHLGLLLPTPAPDATPLPDTTAVGAAGGDDQHPARWADVITWYWANLNQNDPARQALATILAHPTFTGSDLPTKGAVLRLWLFAGPTARPALPQLLDRHQPGNPNAPLIASKSLQEDKTLVQALLDLLQIAPEPTLTTVIAKEQLLDDVITEVLDPNGQVGLEPGGTYTATVLQRLLIDLAPAEYVRLLRGLLAAAPQTTAADGTQFRIPAGIFAAARLAGTLGQNVYFLRTNAELAFTAATLAAGQGDGFPQLPSDPAAANDLWQQAVATGLTADQAARILGALFAIPFTPHQLAWPPKPADDQWVATQRNLRDAAIAEIATKPGQLIASLFWGQQPSGNGDLVHSVVLIDHRDSTTTVENPQYAGSTPPSWAVAGGTSTTPERVYRDPTHTLETIADDDLASWIAGYLTPSAPLVS
jgi:hypothetical protein